MKKIITQIAALIILFLGACKKEPTELVASTKTQFLTNGSWKLTGVMSDEDGNGSHETDDFATFPTCFTDDFIVFKNQQLEINEGLTKCDPGDKQTHIGTWALDNNENNLVINGDIYSIMELSSTRLKWLEDGPGNTSSIVTLTKR